MHKIRIKVRVDSNKLLCLVKSNPVELEISHAVILSHTASVLLPF